MIQYKGRLFVENLIVLKSTPRLRAPLKNAPLARKEKVMFAFQFFVLTVLYLVLAFVLITVVLLVTGKITRPQEKKQYLSWIFQFEWNNNHPFWFLLVATILTGIIALFNWGPALLLPDYPTPEQRGWVATTWEFLLKGNNSKPVETPTTPLPWTSGTWFWWKAVFLYGLLTFFYSFYAFHDEVMRGYQRGKEKAKAREQGNTNPATSHTAQPVNQNGAPKGFGARLLVEFLAEIAAEFVVKFVANKATKGTH